MKKLVICTNGKTVMKFRNVTAYTSVFVRNELNKSRAVTTKECWKYSKMMTTC